MTAATRKLTACLSGMLFLASSAYAHADQKQECARAYDLTQSLRDDGKLINAVKEALACRSAVCPGFIREDCAQWLSEIEALVPTIVFTVEDASGATTLAARLEVDGRVFSQWLDGKAIPIDPGKHELRVEIAGEGVIEKKIVARRGQKNRKILISFKSQAAGSGQAPVVPEPRISPSPPPTRVIAPPAATSGASLAPKPVESPLPPKSAIPTWAWISGSTGLGLLGLSAMFGAIAVSSNDQVRSLCGGDPAHCPESKAKRAAPYVSVRDESTRVFMVLATLGGIGVLSAVLGSIPTGSSSKSTVSRVSVTPFVHPTGGGFSAQGVF